MSSGVERISDIIKGVETGRIINGHSVAALSFLVWDYLITIEYEVEDVWHSRWRHRRAKQALFIVVRYFPMVSQIAIITRTLFQSSGTRFDAAECRSWFIFRSATLSIVISAVQLILVLQVCALYNKRRVVAWPVLALWISHIITAAAVIPIRSRIISLDPQRCTPTSNQFPRVRTMLLGIFVVPFILQITLLALTMRRLLTAIRQGWAYSTPILPLIARDSTWAFFFVACGMIGTFTSVIVKNSTVPVIFAWFESYLSFTGSRLILNMSALGTDDFAAPGEPNSRYATYELQAMPMFTTRTHLSIVTHDVS